MEFARSSPREKPSEVDGFRKLTASAALELFKKGLRSQLERHGVAHRQQVIVAVENWWDKYRVTLRDIEAEWDAAAKRLDQFWQGLGYAER